MHQNSNPIKKLRMTNTKLDIGKNLRQLRTAKKQTQAIIARAIGMNQPGYCDIESNRTTPTIHTLQKLAEFWEVPLVKLLQEEEEKATVNNTNNVGTLNGSISETATNNFFESKEIEEKLKNTLTEAFASAMAREIAKLTKI